MLVSRQEEEKVECRSMNRDSGGALRRGENSLLAS